MRCDGGWYDGSISPLGTHIIPFTLFSERRCHRRLLPMHTKLRAHWQNAFHIRFSIHIWNSNYLKMFYDFPLLLREFHMCIASIHRFKCIPSVYRLIFFRNHFQDAALPIDELFCHFNRISIDGFIVDDFIYAFEYTVV